MYSFGEGDDCMTVRPSVVVAAGEVVGQGVDGGDLEHSVGDAYSY
jgi:hypothetical protein